MDKSKYFKIYNEIFTVFRKLTCENMSSVQDGLPYYIILMFGTRYVLLENNSESGELLCVFLWSEDGASTGPEEVTPQLLGPGITSSVAFVPLSCHSAFSWLI